MTGHALLSESELFFESVIRSYVDGPRFVQRRWLVERFETALADPTCRFLLLTAEPGAGKTAFMAWLARQHPDWPRYFIRRDSQTALSSGDARSFLFTIGHQLAAQRPSLFRPDKLEVVVSQRIGQLQAGGRAVAITVDDLYVSPFYQTALKVEQEAKLVAGDLEGLSVKRMVAEERFLEPSNMQYLALLDPAQMLLKEDANIRIVILVDALDELRSYHGQDSILDWLATCQELPSNVRFVLTSRPEERLDHFKNRQRQRLKEETIDPRSAQVHADLHSYTANFAAEEPVKAALAEEALASSDFVVQVVAKADGNFQYLAAVSRGIEQSLEASDKERLRRLLRVEDIPAGLEELYAFFLTLLKDSVRDQQLEVLGTTPFDVSHLPAWEGLYQPILGVLSVAKEPLALGQIAGFCGVRVEERWIQGALKHLAQFLDREGDRHRLYHNTFPEFLTSPATRDTYPECYLNPTEWHRKIAAHYRGKAPTWSDVNWSRADTYGLRHLLAHLIGAALWDELATASTDLSFLEAKTSQLGVDALLADLRGALRIVPAEGEVRSEVWGLLRLLDREAHNLRGWNPEQHPAFFTQQVHNRAVRMRARPWVMRSEVRLVKLGKPYVRLVWNTEHTSPELERTLFGHTHEICAVAVTPDGQRVISAGADRALRVWDLETGRQEHALTPEANFLSPDSIAVVAMPDGRHVLSQVVDPEAFGFGGDVKVWDLETGGAELTIHGLTHYWAPHRVRQMAVLPSGRRAISGSSSKLVVRDLDNWWGKGRTLGDHGAAISAVAVTPDGRWVLSGADDGTLKQWDLETGRVIRTFHGHNGAIRGITITPNGHWAASTGADHTLKVWDLQTGDEKWTLAGYRDFIAVVTPDGQWAISRADDHTLKVWDLRTGRAELTLCGHADKINAVAVTPDGQRVISASADRTLKIWNISRVSDRTTPQERIFRGHNHAVTALAVTPDGRCALSGSGDGMKVWDVRTGENMQTVGEEHGWVDDIVVTADGRQAIVTASRGRARLTLSNNSPSEYSWSGIRTVTVYDSATWQGVYTITIPYGDALDSAKAQEDSAYNPRPFQNPSPGCSLAVTGNGRNAIGFTRISSGFTLTHWDLQTRVQRQFHCEYTGEISLRAVTPDGRYIILAMDEGVLAAHDLQTGEQVRAFTGHADQVLDVSMTPDGRQVISVSAQTIGVWNIETDRETVIPIAHDYTVKAVTRDGRRAIFASNDGTLMVLALQMDLPRGLLSSHESHVKKMVVVTDNFRAISTADARSLTVWDIDTGQELARTAADYNVESLGLVPGDITILGGDEAGDVFCLRYVDLNAT
jgi:WD40 repeat protein